MRKIVFLLFMFLSACATSKTVIGPDGKDLHHINCSGSMVSWAECYQEAGRLCPQGYSVQNAIGQNQGTTATFNQFGFFASPILIRELLITCEEKKLDGEEEKTYDTNK